MRLPFVSLTLALIVLSLSCGREEIPSTRDALHPRVLASPFGALPENSTFAIRVASFERAKRDAEAFSMNTVGMPVFEAVEDFLLRGGDFIDRMGLDPIRPIWGVEFVSPEGARELVVLYPIEDQGLFLTRHGARIAREGVYRHGSRLIFLQHRYAIVAREPMAETVEAWLSDSDALEGLLSVVSPHSMTLWTRNQALLRTHSEFLVTKLTENLDGPALLIGAPLIMAGMSWLDELAAQTDHTLFALDAHAQALEFSASLSIQPDTALANFRDMRRVSSSRLVAPPLASRAVARGLFNLDPGLLEDARQRVLADLAIFGVKNEPIDEFWEAMRQAWDGSIIGYIDVNREPVWLLGVRDVEAARRFINDSVESIPSWLNPLLETQGLSLETRHDPEAGAYNGVAYGRVAMRVLTHDPEVEPPAVFARVPSAFEYAFTPDGLLLTASEAPFALQALHGDGDRWPGDEGAIDIFAFELDLINLLEAVKRDLVERAAIINPLATLPIPPIETAPVALSVGLDSGEIEIRSLLPAESIKAVFEFYLGGGGWGLEAIDPSDPTPESNER